MKAKSKTTNRNGGKVAANEKSSPAKRRRYVSQADVPRHDIEEALRVARAISDNYGKQPTAPVDVAAAMGMSPTGGPFRSLAGASLAYGFTEGGPKASHIALTTLGRRAVAPTAEGDDAAARREAVMRPRVIREFVEKYNGSRLPKPEIGANVLEAMGVDRPATAETLALILSGAESVGFLRDINGIKYVSLDSKPKVEELDREPPDPDTGALDDGSVEQVDISLGSDDGESEQADSTQLVRRVFITHGKKSKKIVEQLKEILGFGDFEPVVAAENETPAIPVPEKVLDDMRSCGAAVIHISGEQRVLDQAGEEHVMLNENVLIEIGAALALYGSKRFILLVEEGVELPSNLRGLYEARYNGDQLDQTATMKLLRAFKDFRQQP